MNKRLKIKKPKIPKLPKIKRAHKIIKNDVPGTLTYTGIKEQKHVSVELIDYSPTNYTTSTVDDVSKAFNKQLAGDISWINVNGLSQIDQIEKLGQHYNLHPLILEDIVDTNQRPKIDEYPDYLFIVFKMLYYDEHGTFMNEHISLVLGENFLITFQEADGDVFDSLRQRIANAKGRVRNAGSDYLMFAIMDAVVDHYFTLIEVMSDRIESLEDILFANTADQDITQDIQELKREVLRLRKAVFPFREVVNRLEKIDSTLIDEKTVTYIRDLYDHVTQVTDSIDIYREMTWGLMDMYMTTISNKMNEVMKVLTIMASIFIPLTFMAGIYGMNFDYIPELHFKYGYFYLWGAMIAVFLSLLYYFKRKKWL
ncbi:magnesium/cobalt transporter CorA [Leeuwenhoekiella marinoflava]|uniref:Magnesium transport protein CorA n=2 Tax=Leeuwenhoekiella marinoflava TaxID=988 RepID=A0A4Q0PBN4_9FLAO|nr:magnesium/cobalt transporter CorA [Leeuwenhoekiella marinoflava]RXG24105.1 magnesium transporter [Leeuwenhoekiella marinoflava]SHF97839.1 magnesium transporter [Leeuwenhoekiella marinoflava DSM 3653]